MLQRWVFGVSQFCFFVVHHTVAGKQPERGDRRRRMAAWQHRDAGSMHADSNVDELGYVLLVAKVRLYSP